MNNKRSKWDNKRRNNRKIDSKISRKNKKTNNRDNRGSTTVELCFVMPIVLGVIVLCISLLVNTIIDIKAQEMAYSSIYTYAINTDSKDAVNFNYQKIKIKNEKGLVKAQPSGIRGILKYRNPIVLYCTEYDKCTERLRRWQAYGDIFQE